MHKLYYTTRSFTPESTALIPRIALEELSLSYVVEEVELSPSPPDWYVEINRHGQIPTLLLDCNDGAAAKPIAPSPAILLALAESHPEGGLLPETPQEKAVCYACLFDMVEQLHTAYMRVFTPERFSTIGSHAEAITLSSCRSIAAYFTDLNKLLGQQPFVAGAQYSLCDIYFYVMARWYVDISPSDGLPPVTSFDNIFAYCRRIETRAAVRTSLLKDEIALIATDWHVLG
ncbi:glutathione S-transferase family protein [Alphaproteobacteria bacterium]|nr:glutathione S-transferase family protein [Alphaproteobacteria bacterium]